MSRKVFNHLSKSQIAIFTRVQNLLLSSLKTTWQYLIYYILWDSHLKLHTVTVHVQMLIVQFVQNSFGIKLRP